MMRTAKIMMTYLRKRYPWLFIILRIAAAVLGAPGFSFFRLLLEKLLFWFFYLLALPFFVFTGAVFLLVSRPARRFLDYSSTVCAFVKGEYGYH